MIKDTPCVLFAGGKSSRMGEDKSLLPFGNEKTLTEFQLKRLEKIFHKVYISCKSASKFDFKADYIEDEKSYSISAPTLGFYSALKQTEAEALFVLSVDTPFVSHKEILELIEVFNQGNYEAVIAKTDTGVHPLCGIYSHSLLKSFEKMLVENNHRLGQMLKESNTKYLYFENEESFTNLNHPHEYQEALKKMPR